MSLALILHNTSLEGQSSHIFVYKWENFMYIEKNEICLDLNLCLCTLTWACSCQGAHEIKTLQISLIKWFEMIQAQPYKSPSFYVGQMRVTIICDNSLSPIQLYLFIAYNVYEIWHHLLCGKYIML